MSIQSRERERERERERDRERTNVEMKQKWNAQFDQINVVGTSAARIVQSMTSAA